MVEALLVKITRPYPGGFGGGEHIARALDIDLP